ncbi:MAG: hypothetical protein F6K00_19475 [Leptolyngbya sp. SIOISBB]|nr:hypothetical protein [Leptolyngbya sp. SIOISBB]
MKPDWINLHKLALLAVISVALTGISALPSTGSEVKSVDLYGTEVLDMRDALDSRNEQVMGDILCDRYFSDWDYQTYQDFVEGRGLATLYCRVANGGCDRPVDTADLKTALYLPGFL